MPKRECCVASELVIADLRRQIDHLTTVAFTNASCSQAYQEQAREALVARDALAVRLAAVVERHAPFALYGECGHDHADGDPGTILVDDVGLVCEAGHAGTVCYECDTDAGEVREDHWNATYPCPTVRAAEGK